MPDSLRSNLESHLKEVNFEIKDNFHPPAIEIKPDDLLKTCFILYKNEAFYFDQLSCISGLDYSAEEEYLHVVYTLYSIPKNLSLQLVIRLSKSNLEVPSVTKVWKSADWLERETFEMFGVKFTDHPDLRNLLLPIDWEGHPLRKDYKEAETYHGVKLPY